MNSGPDQVEKAEFSALGCTLEIPPDPQRTLTFGERAVGLSFNPSGDLLVHVLKQSYANVIDHLNAVRSNIDDPEVKRLCSVAITEAQGAQMWAVKAVTWKPGS